MPTLSKRLVAAVVALSLVGCTSSTVVRTTRPHARIYIDGEYRGTGAVIHEDQKIVGSTTVVRLEEEGCPPEVYTFSRNEVFDVGACVGGIFFLFPFFWIMGYKPERVFEYRCQGAPFAYPQTAPWPQPADLELVPFPPPQPQTSGQTLVDP